LFNTKVSEAKAEAIIDHLDEGCSVCATARLTHAARVTVARRLKVSGRHAQRFHDQDAGLCQISLVPRLEELVISGAAQLLPRPWQFEDERREWSAPSDTRDGSGIDRSYLVDSRLAPEPDSGGARIITGHDLLCYDGILSQVPLTQLRRT
jgi:hypothetical protein